MGEEGTMRKHSLVIPVILLFAMTAIQAAEYYQKVKKDKRRGEPTEEMALVYVFRPAVVGGAIKTWTFADEKLLGVSKKTAYYFGLVPEGKHIFWSKAENTSPLELEVKGGETYFLKQSIRMGFGKARVKIQQIDEVEAEKYFKKCSFVELTEEGKIRGAEIAANRLERAHTKIEKQKQLKDEKEGDGLN